MHSGRRCRNWTGRDGGDGLSFNAALEDQRGPDADAANENDHFGIDLRPNFGTGVVDQRRHEDLVDGLFPGG